MGCFRPEQGRCLTMLLPFLSALVRWLALRSNRVPLLALLLTLLLSLFLTIQLVDARRQQESRARQEVQNLAALLEARLLAGIREIDVTLRSLEPNLPLAAIQRDAPPASVAHQLAQTCRILNGRRIQ